MDSFITQERLSYFTSILHKNGKSTNTINAYSRNINKLVLFLNGSCLSNEKMAEYKKWLKEKGFKCRTINAYLSAANYFCEVMGWQWMKTELEPLAYDETKNPMVISLMNYNKIVYTALQNDKERLAMMVQVLCHTELRFCELELLTIDILKTGFVEVVRKHQKTKLFIPDVILRDLNTYAKHKKIVSGIIFQTKNGFMVNRSNFIKDLKKICILAGIDENVGSIQHVKNVVLDKYPYYRLNE